MEQGSTWAPVGALIVDDEDDLRLLVRMLIEQHNKGLFVSAEARSGHDALELIDEADPSVVVLDQMMPGMDGVETAARILERRPDQRIVLFSAFLDEELERLAISRGVTSCLLKDRVRDLPPLLLRVAQQ